MSAYLGPVPGGTVQQPRLRVKAGGVALPFPVEAQVTLTNTHEAATWSVIAQMQDTDAMNAAWWSNQSDVRIEIDLSTDGTNYTNILYGITDEVEIDINANELTISGRDLTALFIDIKTADMYQNQTASEIVTLLAKAQGLTPYATATKTPVGQYYASDHVRTSMGDLSSSISQWDLLSYLAQSEGFDVFVQGQGLYFQPMATSTTSTFNVQWSKVAGIPVSNVVNLQLHRSLTLAKDVSVTVQSWNSAANRAVKATATSKANSGKSIDPPQQYLFKKPNLTPSQAADLANLKLAQITRHERVISFDMAGELSLTPRNVVRLSGTGTGFDQLYYPDKIERSIHFEGGYTESVTARNHSPSNDIALAMGGGTQISSLGF